jgi:hypothetical protein
MNMNQTDQNQDQSYALMINAVAGRMFSRIQHGDTKVAMTLAYVRLGLAAAERKIGVVIK